MVMRMKVNKAKPNKVESASYLLIYLIRFYIQITVLQVIEEFRVCLLALKF